MESVSSSNGLELYPKLRFPEFREPWKMQTVELIFQNIVEKNHEDDTVLTIVQGVGTLPRAEAGRNIHYDDASLVNYKQVNYGDFIIHLRSFEGGLEMANQTGIVSPAYTILRNIKPIAFPFYNAYFHTDEFINHVLCKSVEGIRDGRQISYSAFKWLKIPYCDFNEQAKISSLLVVLDKRIKKQAELVDALKKYKRGVINNSFNFTTTNTKYIQLENVCELITKGATPTTYGYKWQTSGIPFFKNDCIRDNRFVYGDCAYITEEANTTLQRSEIRKNDILIAITGDIGKVAIVPDSISKANINQHIARIRLKPDMMINHQYIYYFLCSNILTQQYLQIKTGIAFAQLSLKQIREIKIPVLTEKVQSELVKKINYIDRYYERNTELLSKIIELKKAFTNKLMI